ncbi:MAG: cobalamin B12-binding domain-containing protein [Chloroflexi bacterium]|nr:cobalamin B12-binding domain-containing protein [Chloroflexota bacterium]
MKILLVEPRISSKMVGYTRMIRPEPLALEFIAASVPEHDVRILDLRVDEKPLEKELADFQPDVMGVTGYTTDVPSMRELMRQAKALDPDIITVAGGYHASLLPEDFDLPYVDVLAIGEGENTFRDLVSALDSRQDLAKVPGLRYRKDGVQVATPRRKLSHNLDELPLAARSLTDRYRSRYHFHFWENPYLVETTRGCPYRCNFCSVWVFHNMRSRHRSAECVVNELKSLSGKTRMICFVDDELFQNPKRAERIADLLKAEGDLGFQYWAQVRADDVAKWPHIAEKWRDVGLNSVLVGLEKINDEGLASVNKKTSTQINEKAIHILQDNLGIDIWGAFIVDPSWTKFDFDNLIDYVRSRKIAFPSFTVLTPLPGTQLFAEKVNELITRNYEIFDLLHTVLPTKLPLDEFYANMARLYESTTLGWRDLLNRVKEGRIPRSSLERVRELLKDVTNPEAYLRSAHT